MTSASTDASPDATRTSEGLRVIRVEVRAAPGVGDPRAESLIAEANALGFSITSARTTRVYLIESSMGDWDAETIRSRLLEDPVTERAAPGIAPTEPGLVLIEVHPLPGVMDPTAQTVQDAVRELVGAEARVSTGWRYDLAGISEQDAVRLGERLLANPVVQAIHTKAHWPESFPVGRESAFEVTHVPIRELDDAGLERLSRDGHLFLSLDEMRAIRDEFRTLEREPTDIELETLAQTWSEHCVHKTLKSTIRYTRSPECPGIEIPGLDTPSTKDRPGHVLNADGSVTIHNLLKSTVAAATHELIADGVDWTLSVFVDNAGIIEFDEDHAVCVKVETHNHPSAIEPYGGAATGIGGCIRDIIGTGMAAKPIASMDVFCVADPTGWHTESANSESDTPEIRYERSDAPFLRIDGMVGELPFYLYDLSDIGRVVFAMPFDPSVEPESVAAGEADGYEADIFLKSNQTAADLTNNEIDRIVRDHAHVAHREYEAKRLPAGCLHPKRILTEIVGGVRDYGNRMGIPTVNGAVWFDDRYVGNPLVYCGCVGVMPRGKDDALIAGDAQPGDRIIALGGRTGRDGIHGATFSSAELTDTHADEFSHAVQIGNAIEEKRVLDAILRARDVEGGPLFTAITDCGAGGFSSAVGEMGEKIGAEVHLDRAPLKYDGLTYDEIWISEAQERMVLAVPADRVEALQHICDEEHVELADLGRFGTEGDELILNFHGREVGRLPMAFLHDGIPTPTREAVWSPSPRGTGVPPVTPSSTPPGVTEVLTTLLAHPNIASKHWIIRQYDHEVQGATALTPLVGPLGRGPGDAAVVEPVPGSGKGLAIACGLSTGIGDPDTGGDPYLMALGAIDECVRNLVCVGANPDRIAILDNFCWPSCQNEKNLGTLVRAAEGCYDAAMAYRTPFVSGKDSLNNQFTIPGADGESGRTIEIPPTLLISAVAIVESVDLCVTMDMKAPDSELFIVEPWQGESAHNPVRLGGSHYERLFGLPVDAAPDPLNGFDPGQIPRVDLEQCPLTARAIAIAISRGLVASCHDCSDGGALVALAEMLIAGSTPEHPIGAWYSSMGATARLFSERPGCYVLEVSRANADAFRTLMTERGAGWTWVGRTTSTGELELRGNLDDSIGVEALARAWRGTLDW